MKARRAGRFVGRALALSAVLLLLLGLAGVVQRLPGVGSASSATPPVGGLDGGGVLSLLNRAPTFSPAPGIYEHSVLVELQASYRQGQIVYTLDGTRPSAEVGTRYQGPLHLDADVPDVVVIRAVEVVDGEPGPVATGVYVVGLGSTLPVLSVAVPPAALWDAERGILTHPWARGRAWERAAHVTYLAPDGGQVAIPAGLRVHEADAAKPSLRLYFRNAYGDPRLDFPLFPGHPRQSDDVQSYKRLLLQAGDSAGRWTMFRDQLLVEVANELGVPAAQGRIVHLFVNGESWGLYRLSERVDRFFLEDNLGIGRADLVQDGRQREGTDEDWDALMDWVEAADLGDAVTYATLAAQVDLRTFTDLAVLHLYFDVPAAEIYAARPRGGRWFFLYGGGTRAFAPRADVLPATLHGAQGDFARMLRALWANPAYRQRFAGRLAVLLNTTLTPASMRARAEPWVAALAPEAVYEAARWPHPLAWEDNVAALLDDFIPARPAVLRSHVAAALGLGAPVGVRFAMLPPEGGQVFVMGAPTSGAAVFFAGTSLSVVAAPEPGYAFAGWEGAPGASPALGASPEVTLTLAGPSVVTATFRPAPHDPGARRPDAVVINELWIDDDGTRYPSLGYRPIEGDWVELWVRRDGVDLRGWRLTDNDTKAGRAEGSLRLPDDPALAAVPRDTVVLLIATATDGNAAHFPEDDLDPRDGRLLLYRGNGNLDASTDPGFDLGAADDNLALLAPGPGPGFADDVGVDFVAEGFAVTPASFGVLADGVTFPVPFRRLGGDDGALFAGRGGNDAVADWEVDPPAHRSGDALRADAVNLVTPGRLNPQQAGALRWAGPWWAVLAVLVAAFLAVNGVVYRVRRGASRKKRASAPSSAATGQRAPSSRS
jgi:hypothetical protein